ncbi:hypothetical protein LGM58_20180 [Burkholderia contaminans]|uniref:hypothetical protein n=1 Tax=Burkholderia contaminans TaxID=488447 RepID=UPI001CF24EE1|nr:hypothetical protein [Burkholderia contaminans]MCA7885504.1 hypothetical protein [Burkholderia contaminans]
MRIPSLPTIADLIKHIRLGLFLILLAIGGTQIVTMLRGPADQAPGHFIVAAVTLGVGIRLYAAKRSSINRAAAELERLAARNRNTP